MNRTIQCIILIFLLSFCFPLKSQEIHGNTDIWFLLLNHYKINDRWSLGNEFHMRYSDFLNEEEQLLIRPFINYHANPNVVISFGYTFINTYPYGDYPVPSNKPENNIWEQVTLIQDIGRASIQHRYRWENRWQGNLVQDIPGGPSMVDGFSYSNRFRYRITIRRPINDRFFINVFDELWFAMDKKLRNVNYDRNWIYLGLGININEKLSIQAAYLHQYVKNNPTRYERHPTLQITLDARLR